MTTLTIYCDSDDVVGNDSGFMSNGSGSDPMQVTNNYNGMAGTGANYGAFFRFPTSGIPTGVAISSAVLWLSGASVNSGYSGSSSNPGHMAISSLTAIPLDDNATTGTMLPAPNALLGSVYFNTADPSFTWKSLSVTATVAAAYAAGRTATKGFRVESEYGALNNNTFEIIGAKINSRHGSNIPYVVVTYSYTPGPAGAITEPDVGATYDASIVLTCGGATDPDTASGSLYYDWDYSTNGGGSWTNIGLSAMGSLTKTWNCSALAAGTTFKVRVRPYDGANYGTYTTLGGNFSIVHTSKMKRWTGSAWVSHNLSRWNGTAWVATHLKRWTGSAWVDE